MRETASTHNLKTKLEKGTPLFPLGKLTITPESADRLFDVDVLPVEVWYRPQCGNWGNLPEEDIQSNESALLRGGRIVSRYEIPFSEPVYVITECDRSQTVVFLASEY